MLPDCLSWLVHAKLTDHEYESKGQEFGKTLCKELTPITATNNYINILTIDILDDSPDIKVLQQWDAYYKHICNSLYLPQYKVYS